MCSSVKSKSSVVAYISRFYAKKYCPISDLEPIVNLQKRTKTPRERIEKNNNTLLIRNIQILVGKCSMRNFLLSHLYCALCLVCSDFQATYKGWTDIIRDSVDSPPEVCIHKLRMCKLIKGCSIMWLQHGSDRPHKGLIETHWWNAKVCHVGDSCISTMAKIKRNGNMCIATKARSVV